MPTFNRMHLIRQVDLFTLQLFLSAIEERQIGLAAIRENIAASTALCIIANSVFQAAGNADIVHHQPAAFILKYTVNAADCLYKVMAQYRFI